MNSSKLTFAAGVVFLAFALVVFLGAACKETPPSGTAGGTAQAGECDGMVIAKVGDVDLTLADLLQMPTIYMAVDDGMIMQELLRQEAARRGISLTQEEIQKGLDDFYAGRGGKEKFMESVPPSIPKSLVDGDIRRMVISQALQKAILENAWEKDHGPVTDEEVDTIWNERGQMFIDQTAAELQIDPAQVTKEMAVDKVKDEIKNRWLMEQQTKLFENLKKTYNVRNLLRERLGEQEEIEAPPATEDTTQTSGTQTEETVSPTPPEASGGGTEQPSEPETGTGGG